jgi:hypothetical protein
LQKTNVVGFGDMVLLPQAGHAAERECSADNHEPIDAVRARAVS